MLLIIESTICLISMPNTLVKLLFFSIETGDILEGSIPTKKARLVQAWIEIHREDLMADWNIAIEGGEIFKIEPLR